MHASVARTSVSGRYSVQHASRCQISRPCLYIILLDSLQHGLSLEAAAHMAIIVLLRLLRYPDNLSLCRGDIPQIA